MGFPKGTSTMNHPRQRDWPQSSGTESDRHTSTADETERVRRVWNKHAPDYDRSMALTEKLFLGNGRPWACSQASGDVLEIAVGTGRNFPFFPDAVRLTGIELSTGMLAIARGRAQELGRTMDVREG